VTSTRSEHSWREALEAGHFDEAHRLYLLLESPEPGLRRALSTLADLEALVRDKAWARAGKRLERLDERPPVLDWPRLEAELERLASSSRELDRIQPEDALRLLDSVDTRWFVAEEANQRGTASVYGGDPKGARQHFREAVELDPSHYRALTNLGNALLETGEVDEAISCYQRALTLNDEFANAHHNLGVAYRRQGKVGASVRELRRAQRVQQRVGRERDREAIGEGGGKAGLKALRWLLYALVVLAALGILRAGGLL
jgi:tetratricopeptide (TPR) repeat protein